jgi:hypothetical protein
LHRRELPRLFACGRLHELPLHGVLGRLLELLPLRRKHHLRARQRQRVSVTNGQPGTRSVTAEFQR